MDVREFHADDTINERECIPRGRARVGGGTVIAINRERGRLRVASVTDFPRAALKA